MEFKDLKIGDTIYILESIGTFRKITTYNTGQVVNVTMPYENSNMNNTYLQQVLNKKLVDVTITCEGIQKKISVDANKNIITDSSIGLTIATNKEDLITLVNTQLREYEAKIASIQFYKDEADKCKSILNALKNQPQNKQIQSVDKTDSIRVS